MSPDIVIIRDGERYRLLHGHLRLANVLRLSNEASVEVRGEGSVQIVRARDQYIVRKDGRRLPLHIT